MKKLSIVMGFIICTAFNRSECFTDYRDPYVGSYFCHRSSTIMKIDRSPKLINDTLTVTVSKGNIDSVMQIKTGPVSYLFKLKSGILHAYPDGYHGMGSFFGSDSIMLTIPIGRTSSSSLIGKKK